VDSIEQPGLYQDPGVYDILHTPGTAEEVDGLERIAQRLVEARGAAAKTWLEPACGSGRYLRVAAGRGHRAVGFDLNDAMVAYAKRRVRADDDARFFIAPMESFVGRDCPAGSVGFAFNLINSFRHLMDDVSALAHLEQMSRALAPGGVYAVGLSLTSYGVEQPSEDVWSGARGRCRVTQIVQFEPGTAGARRERVHSHLVVTRPSGERHLDSRYELRTYNMEQWENLIARSAMREVACVDELGDDADRPRMGYRVFILRPRRSPAANRSL